MSFTAVTLTGTVEVQPGVSATAGIVTATLSEEISDGVIVVAPSPISATIGTDGTFSLATVANDDSTTTPTGTYYTFTLVTTSPIAGTVDSFKATVPHTAGSTTPLYSLPRV